MKLPTAITHFRYSYSAFIITALFASFGQNAHGSLFPTKVVASTQEARSFLGANRAKLVYINNAQREGQLCYIDFSEDVEKPVVRKIAKVTGAAVPVISPDGRWVVYAIPGSQASGEAGSISTNCSVYICEIAENATPVQIQEGNAFEPRFIQNSEKLTVIFPTKAPDHAWEDPAATTVTVTIDTVGGILNVGQPQTLIGNGGYTGGLSWDERYLAAGGGMGVMLDRQSSDMRPDTVASLFPLRKPGGSYEKTMRDPKIDPVQACNVSITSSRKYTNAMMYLEWGSQYGKINDDINNGLPWDTWEIIFLCNNKGTTLAHYSCPENEDLSYVDSAESRPKSNQWHHCEWSNHPYYAASALLANRVWPNPTGLGWIPTDYQERIFFINLKDSTYLEIAQPEYLENNEDWTGHYWPWLWVEIPEGFEEENCWLGPADSTCPASVRRMQSFRARAFAMTIHGQTAHSDQPLRSISIYCLDGSRVAQLRPEAPSRRIDIPALGRLSAGSYIIMAETMHNRRVSLRYLAAQ